MYVYFCLFVAKFKCMYDVSKVCDKILRILQSTAIVIARILFNVSRFSFPQQQNAY